MTMWYDNLGIISIGAQCGGPEDGGLGDIKIDLWKQFMRHCKNSYCPAIAHYALVLRIGGEFQDYGPESIEKMRRNKADKTIGVDIVIPQKIWHGRTRNELRDYLAKQVKASLKLCVTRLRKDKEPVDEDSLFREIDKSINEFVHMDYGSDADY